MGDGRQVVFSRQTRGESGLLFQFRCTFSSNHNVNKRLCGFCFGNERSLIKSFYKNTLIKGPLSPKQTPYNFSFTLWFDENVYLMYIYTSVLTLNCCLLDYAYPFVVQCSVHRWAVISEKSTMYRSRTVFASSIVQPLFQNIYF